MKRASTILLRVMMLAGLWLSLVPSARGFALLGPYAPWMQISNGYRIPGYDYGGPMNLTEEYRWNIPVVTYGFDQSFISYFGSNGVAAVEEAIQILNDLPPASQIVLTNYPFDTRRVNLPAQNLLALDLKSTVLNVLLQNIGLADPSRYVFTIRDINIITNTGSANTTNYTVAQRNFDPVTTQPTPWIDGILYTYQLLWPAYFVNNTPVADAVDLDAELLRYANSSAVANQNLYVGKSYTGLTYDDVGGIRYLLSAQNINAETLPTDVIAAGSNPNAFVNAALRPGVEKITFVHVSYDSLIELTPPFTNVFTDTYFSNGVPVQQTLKRVVTHPDILFTASDLGVDIGGLPFTLDIQFAPWQNNAALNGDATGAGPGVIQPGARITFNKSEQSYINESPWALNEGNAWNSYVWGSFSTNEVPPILYPTGTPLPAPQNVFVRFENSDQGQQLHWRMWGTPYRNYQFESSTNLVDWSTVTNVFNLGGLLDFQRPVSAGPRLFYRAKEQ